MKSITHTEISSYQSEYIKHPINTWKKPPPEKAAQYKPYDYINSSYREHYPGQKPQMREKIVPRVKNQNKNVPFDASSEYSKSFGPKNAEREKPFIKDMQYNPDKQPFNPSTTYSAFFEKKQPNPHEKPSSNAINYPEGYKFNPNTTYSKDFSEKQPNVNKSFKPVEVIAEKGPHDLSTIYRQDFKEKPQPEVCPVLKLPSLPKQLSPGSWVEK